MSALGEPSKDPCTLTRVQGPCMVSRYLKSILVFFTILFLILTDSVQQRGVRNESKL